jgi:GT2 family glycosyltransferase
LGIPIPAGELRPRLVLQRSEPGQRVSLEAIASVTVVICCYSERRWNLLMASIASACAQEYPHTVVVVVDHSEKLYRRLLLHVPADVLVLRNVGAKGASGARNTAAARATSDYLVFLDDDAHAEPGWLRALTTAMGQAGVVGAGGHIEPAWSDGHPRWFPPEFGWVVGASFPGQVTSSGIVRNVWSGSMIVRRDAFQAAGGFREGFGKVGGVAEPEDTELCLRLTEATGGRWVFEPSAVVHHAVPPEREKVSYFVRRCWMEGRGKAGLRSIAADRSTSLSSESRYVRQVLPRAMRRYLAQVVSIDPAALAKAVCLALGLMTTVSGFALESVRKRARRP